MKILSVVPAKAGTHRPWRQRYGAELAPRRSSNAGGYESRRKAGTTRRCCLILQPLDDGDVRHAAAFAHGLQAVALVALLERVDQRRHQLGAGAAQRMAARAR